MITYVFPGQGSQVVGMGEELFKEFPEYVKKADEILGYSIEELCLRDPENKLSLTQYTQPALYIVSALEYLKRLKETGIKPDYVAGHSLGEYVAIFASGGFDFETGLKLVKKRGQLMSRENGGAMAAVIGIDKEKVIETIERNSLDQVDVANFNSGNQTVISGPQQAIDDAQPYFEEVGARYVKLKVSAAFHSRYMKNASDEFEKYIRDFTFSNFQIPVISNVKAEPYQMEEVSENLVKQLRSSVQWLDTVEYLLDKDINMEFEEIGPGRVLTNLVRKIKADYKPKKKLNERYNAKDAVRMVKEWNDRHQVGTTVKCQGFEEILCTKTPAVVLFGHRAAVYMEGYNGYFDLSELEIL